MASLVRCAHCGASLLAADYLGQPAAAMDRALAHHFARRCLAGPSLSEACLAGGPLPWVGGEPPLVC